MKTQKSDLLKNVEEILEKTRFFFVNKYFGKEHKSFWSGSKVGTTLHVADYTFTIEEVLEFLRNNASREQMFGYREYQEEEFQINREPLDFKKYKQNLMRHK